MKRFTLTSYLLVNRPLADAIANADCLHQKTAGSVSEQLVLAKHLSKIIINLVSPFKGSKKLVSNNVGHISQDVLSFSAVTLYPVCWVARFPTNPPVPASASQHGGKLARRLTTWQKLPDQQCTAASIRMFTASASRPSLCRAGPRGPVIPQTTQAQAHTVQRGLTVTSLGLPPSVWASGTQSLSLHWWLTLLTDWPNA